MNAINPVPGVGSPESSPMAGTPDSFGSSVAVRRAMHWEAPAINRLIHDSMMTYISIAGIREDHLDALREGVPEVLEAMRTSVVLVAVDDSSTVVGTVRLCFRSAEHYPEAAIGYKDDHPSDTAVMYLTRFAVLQTSRGNGIGSLLISEAERIARSEGVRYILLHTALSNETVAGFYQRRGFSIDSVDLSRGYPRALFIKRLS